MYTDLTLIDTLSLYKFKSRKNISLKIAYVFIELAVFIIKLQGRTRPVFIVDINNQNYA